VIQFLIKNNFKAGTQRTTDDRYC